MDYRGRRGRRGRSQYHQFSPPRGTSSSLLGVAIKNLVITAGVICLVFMMMHYNCSHCYSRQELSKLASSVDEIAKHLDTIKSDYEIMETKLAIYSQELPKLEVQMAALEALARTVQVTGFGWDPSTHTSLPYVDVNLNKLNEALQNISVKNDTKTPIRPLKLVRVRRNNNIRKK